MYRLKTIVLFTNSSANAQSPSRQLYSPTFPSSLPSLLPLLTSCISPSLHSSLLHSLPDRVPMSLPRFLAPRRTRTSASMFPCYPEISTRIRAQRIFSLRIFFACCSSLPPQPVLVMYLVGNKVVNIPFFPLLVVCSNAASSFPPLLQRCLFFCLPFLFPSSSPVPRRTLSLAAIGVLCPPFSFYLRFLCFSKPQQAQPLAAAWPANMRVC